MSDLISRSALMSRIESERRQWGEDYDAEQILGDIEDMPVAYDPDKVVEQLEEIRSKREEQLRSCCGDKDMEDYLRCKMSGIAEAIEIVKGGGIE